MAPSLWPKTRQTSEFAAINASFAFAHRRFVHDRPDAVPLNSKGYPSAARKIKDLIKNDLRPSLNNAFPRCQNMSTPVPNNGSPLFSRPDTTSTVLGREKQDFRQKWWDCSIDTLAEMIVAECPFIVKVTPSKINYTGSRLDICYGLFIDYLDSNSTKQSCFTPIIADYGPTPRQKNFCYQIVEDGWLHTCWDKQNAVTVKQFIDRLSGLVVVDSRPVKTYDHGGSYASCDWLPLSTIYSAVEITRKDRWVDPKVRIQTDDGQAQIEFVFKLRGMKAWTTLRGVMQEIVTTTPRMTGDGLHTRTAVVEDIMKLYDQDLVQVHAPEPVLRTAQADVRRNFIGGVEVVDLPTDNRDETAPTAASGPDTVVVKAEIVDDSGSVDASALFEAVDNDAEAFRYFVNQRHCFRPFTDRDTRINRQYNQKFTQTELKYFNDNPKPCAGYADVNQWDKPCPHGQSDSILTLDTASLRHKQLTKGVIEKVTVAYANRCSKCYALDGFCKYYFLRNRQIDGRAACAKSPYCVAPPALLTDQGGVRCVHHFMEKVADEARRSRNSRTIAMTNDEKKKVRDKVVGKPSPDGRALIDGNPDDERFVDTEYQYNPVDEAEILTQVAVLDGRRNILVHWKATSANVQMSRSLPRNALSQAEEDELRQSLETHIKPHHTMIEWSVNYCDWDHLRPFCDTLPPRDQTVRLCMAYKTFLTGYCCRLDALYPIYFPDMRDMAELYKKKVREETAIRESYRGYCVKLEGDDEKRRPAMKRKRE
ncbi:hypothetical protein PMZ80_000215 [Knufia obscura]|uniref:Uncharacterized protein n=1 Tax=Knufia obscura TaxID=1635080 RepID=A0ABR0RZT5_9EURO|nr:hypothetical protein PMZ80_000215 [Knufia obscura]